MANAVSQNAISQARVLGGVVGLAICTAVTFESVKSKLSSKISSFQLKQPAKILVFNCNIFFGGAGRHPKCIWGRRQLPNENRHGIYHRQFMPFHVHLSQTSTFVGRGTPTTWENQSEQARRKIITGRDMRFLGCEGTAHARHPRTNSYRRNLKQLERPDWIFCLRHVRLVRDRG